MMKRSLSNQLAICLTFAMFIQTITASSSSTSDLRLSSPIKPVAESNPIMEGRSLLDLLLGGGSSEGNAATSVKGSGGLTEKNSSPLVDLAHSLIGKDNGNANLYIKIFKLILNLFMDVMMDRMDGGAKRRESTSDILPILSLLRPQNYIMKRNSQDLYERPAFLANPLVNRQRVFKPYFVQ